MAAALIVAVAALVVILGGLVTVFLKKTASQTGNGAGEPEVRGGSRWPRQPRLQAPAEAADLTQLPLVTRRLWAWVCRCAP